MKSSKSIIIQIPQPCSEKWDLMTPSSNGRTCDACNKVVIDFTKHTDRQLIAFAEENYDQKVCGHFGSRQLNREITGFDYRYSNFGSISALVFAAIAMTSTPVYAQEPAASPQQVLPVSSPSKMVDSSIQQVFSGQLVDSNGEAIVSATVSLMFQGNLVMRVMSDFDGFFKLVIPDEKHFDTLSIQSFDFYDFKMPLTFNSSTNLGKIELTPAEVLLEGLMIIERIEKPTRRQRREDRRAKQGN